MEDRITAGLYLEMTNQSAADYAARRVPQVLALPKVERATWWTNQKPDREDLPRRLAEFLTLGVYEVERGFERPATPRDVTGHHFLHYPRPGQGNLSGRPTLGLELVLISPRTPEGAQALRDWGDFVHIRHIAAASCPGFTMITPYENASGGEPRFMHFYELDTGDPEPAFRQMTPTTMERRVGPRGSALYQEWANHEQLVIEYVNTFARVGVATP